MTYIQPLLLVALLMTVAGILRIRPGKGKLLASTGILGVFLLSWPPFAWLVTRPLEASYPVRPFYPNVPPEAIVVLSAAAYPPHFERPYALPDRETFERCMHAAWLARQYPGLPVLASGGHTEGMGDSVSKVMRDFLETQNVPGHAIWTEEESHNTYENALYSSALLKRHNVQTIALVVDASSMPRAAACFRKQGITVLPAPSKFSEFGSLSDELMPTWKALQQNENSLHEILGLLWYRVQGRI